LIQVVIPSLQAVEEKLVKLLEIASKTCQELANTEQVDSRVISSLSIEYLNLIKEIKEALTTQISRVNDELPYQKSIYGERKDLEILNMKVTVILEHFHQMLLSLGKCKQNYSGEE